MESSILKAVSFGCAICLVFACNEKKEASTVAQIDKEQIKKEIQTKENEFADLYNRGELKNIGYYADDATSFFQNRTPLIGKEAILAFLRSDLVSNPDKIAFKTSEVFVSNDANQVVEVGYFTVFDSTNTLINSGNYMTLFEKRNGSYLAVRDMSASDKPID